MSQIALTVPVGVLTEEGKKTVQRDLARALLSWEGAPDQDIFKSLLWSYLHELPRGAQVTAADEAPRFRVDVTVPAGTMDDERRAGLVKEVTELVLAAADLGADQALRVWVLLHEQPDGTWGAGGRIMRLADIAGMGSN